MSTVADGDIRLSREDYVGLSVSVLTREGRMDHLPAHPWASAESRPLVREAQSQPEAAASKTAGAVAPAVDVPISTTGTVVPAVDVSISTETKPADTEDSARLRRVYKGAGKGELTIRVASLSLRQNDVVSGKLLYVHAFLLETTYCTSCQSAWADFSTRAKRADTVVAGAMALELWAQRSTQNDNSA